MGIVSAAILLIVSFLLVYYWVSVQQAYVELGNRDYMYSPAPTKVAIFVSTSFQCKAFNLIKPVLGFSIVLRLKM